MTERIHFIRKTVRTMSNQITLIKCTKCGKYYAADARHRCPAAAVENEPSTTDLKSFVDKLEKIIREEAAAQLVESEITYIDIDRNDIFDISLKAGYKGSSLTVLQLELGELPASMTVWKDERIRQRVREELAIVAHGFNTGDCERFTGAFSFVCCYPWEE